MMKPQKDNRKNALAQIHIAKKQLGMDEDTYRENLHQVTGKRSCSDMHISELYRVIAHMEKCGFKRKKPAGKKQQYSPKASGQYIDVMRAIWIQMHQCGMIEDGSETALERWAKRQSSQLNKGIGIDKLSWLERDAKMASKIIDCLKQWCKRVSRQWENEDFAKVQNYMLEHNLKPEGAIKQMLEQHRVMYWPKFADYGVENDNGYCVNRRDIKHV